MTMHRQSSARGAMVGMSTDLAQLNQRYESSLRARGFVKYIAAQAIAARNKISVVNALEQMSGVDAITKATVAAQTSTNASALLSESRAFVAEVVARQTVLGRLTGTLSAPPNTPIPTASTDPVGEWVREGYPIPLGSLDLVAPRTAISKYAFIVAFTEELLRMSDDRGLNVIERVSTRAIRHAEDALLLSDIGAVDQGNPAGLLSGLTAVGDGSPTTLAVDFEALWTAVEDGDPDRPYFVISPRGAMYLAALREEGTPRFPDISPATGGSLFGVPVLLAKAAGDKVILIDASKLAVTDEGLEIQQSRQTSINMVDHGSPVATTLVSLWQVNSAALRFVRYIHWTKLSDDAVAFLELPINGSPA